MGRSPGTRPSDAVPPRPGDPPRLHDPTTIGPATLRNRARLVEATGRADYLSTSIGVATASLHLVEASMHTLSGYASFIPAAIRRAVSLERVAATIDRSEHGPADPV